MSRIVGYGAHGDVLYAWCNVPMLYLPGHAVALTCNLLYAGARAGCFFSSLNGLVRGYTAILRQLNQRQPVTPLLA
jgi:hypothetical protein